MNRRGDARTRILPYFILGIALPSGLLGYLAFRGIQNDRAFVERERRSELEEISARLDSAMEVRLDELERALSTAPEAGLGRIVAEEPAVRAVFGVDLEGTVRVVAAEGPFFARNRAPVPRESSPGPADVLLASARRVELRQGGLEEALSLYRRALDVSEEDGSSAAALGGIARIERKIGRPGAAAATYERLRTELGDVPSAAGVPWGAAASIELSSLLLESGDSAGAAAVLVELHGDVVSGRWSLTPARFDLLATAGREVLETLVAAGAFDEAGGGRTLQALHAEEVRVRERALAFAAFEDEAGRLLGRGGREGRDRPGLRLDVVQAGGESFAVFMGGGLQRSGASDRRGLVVDPGILLSEVFGSAVGEEGRSRIAWSLLTREGEVAGSSEATPAPDAPVVRSSLSGLPSWSLDLSLSVAALGGGFPTSRRAVYLGAFVLIAGILLFGLSLTIRSVGRELELARMKSDFVSTVSHEFRSPLTAIRQLAEMLSADRVASDERRRRYYHVLLEQSERLSMLVDNVLDFARMDAGRREMSVKPVDLRALVEDTVSDARRRVAHEGFAIRTELEEGLPPVRVDSDAVRQALSNLIDNGVKYSGESRELVVRGFHEKGDAVLAVRDFGIGMSRPDAARAFERFYRGGDPLTRSVKGTGLGLTIVKQIVEAHGGRVEVRSEPGRGSTLSMRFPTDRGNGRTRAGSEGARRRPGTGAGR